jgi:GT2 family glycosyltransferase/glycosyltransferase involved in cell wall biosynthesis
MAEPRDDELEEEDDDPTPWRAGWERQAADVLLLGIVPWEERWQRPHHFADQLAQRGHRVVYVSPLFGQRRRARVLRRPPTPEGVVFAQLSTASLTSIHEHPSFTAGDMGVLVTSFRQLFNQLRLRCPIVLVQSPGWWPLVEWLGQRTDFPIVYDCLDEHRGWNHEAAERLAAWEGFLAARSDLVLASAEPLRRKLEPHNWNVTVVPNGCEYTHFEPAGEPNGALVRLLPRPIVGYYGAISSTWFDTDLVATAAELRPDLSFVLIGPADEEAQHVFDAAPNVLALGSIPYRELPRYCADFDVATIPFLVNELTSATDPVKLYEYFAAGKPVVTTPMRELFPFQGLLEMADTAGAFVEAVERALADPGDREARRAIAREAEWSARVDLFYEDMLATLPSLDVVVVSYGGPALTRDCLASLAADGSYPAQVIVVDNGSGPETQELLDEHEERGVLVLRNEQNVGFSAANNQGIRAGSGRYVLLLNNDTIVPQGTFLRVANTLARARDVGLAGAVTNRIGNEAEIVVPYDDASPEALRDVGDMLGWWRFGLRFDIGTAALFAAALRRRDLEAVGGLAEEYALGMFEDDELSERIRRLGKRVVCCEDVFVHHAGGASFGRLDPVIYRAVFDRNRRVFERGLGRPWLPHTARTDREQASPDAEPAAAGSGEGV